MALEGAQIEFNRIMAKLGYPSAKYKSLTYDIRDKPPFSKKDSFQAYQEWLAEQQGLVSVPEYQSASGLAGGQVTQPGVSVGPGGYTSVEYPQVVIPSTSFQAPSLSFLGRYQNVFQGIGRFARQTGQQMQQSYLASLARAEERAEKRAIGDAGDYELLEQERKKRAELREVTRKEMEPTYELLSGALIPETVPGTRTPTTEVLKDIQELGPRWSREMETGLGDIAQSQVLNAGYIKTEEQYNQEAQQRYDTIHSQQGYVSQEQIEIIKADIQKSYEEGWQKGVEALLPEIQKEFYREQGFTGLVKYDPLVIKALTAFPTTKAGLLRTVVEVGVPTAAFVGAGIYATPAITATIAESAPLTLTAGGLDVYFAGQVPGAIINIRETPITQTAMTVVPGTVGAISFLKTFKIVEGATKPTILFSQKQAGQITPFQAYLTKVKGIKLEDQFLPYQQEYLIPAQIGYVTPKAWKFGKIKLFDVKPEIKPIPELALIRGIAKLPVKIKYERIPAGIKVDAALRFVKPEKLGLTARVYVRGAGAETELQPFFSLKYPTTQKYRDIITGIEFPKDMKTILTAKIKTMPLRKKYIAALQEALAKGEPISDFPYKIAKPGRIKKEVLFGTAENKFKPTTVKDGQIQKAYDYFEINYETRTFRGGKPILRIEKAKAELVKVPTKLSPELMGERLLALRRGENLPKYKKEFYMYYLKEGKVYRAIRPLKDMFPQLVIPVGKGKSITPFLADIGIETGELLKFKKNKIEMIGGTPTMRGGVSQDILEKIFKPKKVKVFTKKTGGTMIRNWEVPTQDLALEFQKYLPTEEAAGPLFGGMGLDRLTRSASLKFKGTPNVENVFVPLKTGVQPTPTTELITPTLEIKPVSITETRPITRLEPKIGTRLEPRMQTRLEPRMQTRLEPKLITRLEPKLTTRLEPKLSTRLEPRLSTRITTRLEPRLQTRLVTRLAPRVTSPVAFPVIAKTGEKKPKEPKEEVSPAYQLFVRRKGKWIKLGKPTVKGIALKKGSEFAQRTLGASFKVEPTKAKIKAEEIPYVPSPKVFRKPKVKGKTELKSPIFIQRGGKEPTFVKGARLAAPSEKAELKLSRRKIKWR